MVFPEQELNVSHPLFPNYLPLYSLTFIIFISNLKNYMLSLPEMYAEIKHLSREVKQKSKLN